MSDAFNPAGAELALWRAVILRAMADATGDNITGYERSARKLIEDDARNWLLDGRRDFHLVCQFAELDPDFVRERAAKMIAEADRRRGEEGPDAGREPRAATLKLGRRPGVPAGD